MASARARRAVVMTQRRASLPAREVCGLRRAVGACCGLGRLFNLSVV